MALSPLSILWGATSEGHFFWGGGGAHCKATYLDTSFGGEIIHGAESNLDSRFLKVYICYNIW